MKATVNIPDSLIQEAMRRSSAATRTRVVIEALEEYVRRRRVNALLELEGRIGYWDRNEWHRFRHGKTRSR